MTSIDYQFSRFGPFVFQSSVPDSVVISLREMGDRARKANNDLRHKLAGHLRHEYSFDESDRLEAEHLLMDFFVSYYFGYDR